MWGPLRCGGGCSGCRPRHTRQHPVAAGTVLNGESRVAAGPVEPQHCQHPLDAGGMGTRDSHSLVTGGFDETPVSAACGNALEAPRSGGDPPKPRGDPPKPRGTRQPLLGDSGPGGRALNPAPFAVFSSGKCRWQPWCQGVRVPSSVSRRARRDPGGPGGSVPAAAGRCGRGTGGTRLGVPVRDVSAPCPGRGGVTVTHLYLWGGPLPPETAVPQCPHNVPAEPS